MQSHTLDDVLSLRIVLKHDQRELTGRLKKVNLKTTFRDLNRVFFWIDIT